VFVRRAIVIAVLGLGCGRHINPEWCAVHQDPACAALPGDASSDASGSHCTMNTDCASQLCLPNGACAQSSTVLYASPTGTGTACTAAAKCTLDTAIAQVAAGRSTIALDPGTYTGQQTIAATAQLVGRGATIVGSGAGPAVIVSGGNVELDYLTLSGAAASGVRCDAGSLYAHAITSSGNSIGVHSFCALRLDRSRVTQNSTAALEIAAGSIDVHANFLVNNGASSTMKNGAVHFANGVTGTFAFNTVAYNDVMNGFTTGVRCDAAIAGVGNLVSDNQVNGAFNASPQVSGMCDASMWYAQPGTGNNDLKWVNPTAGDFHLTAASTPVLDVPGLVCTGEVDIDGDPRPLGAGCDYGADEL